MFRLHLSILLLLLSLHLATAQVLLKGIVADSASFEPLSNVSVRVKGQNRGTITDAQGNFGINANRTDTLVLSLLGYNPLEVPLLDYEPSMIMMTQKVTILKPIVVSDRSMAENPYEGLFDEQNAALKRKIPFYYSRARKDKIKAGRWKEEVLRVQTYVDVVIQDPETRANLMKRYKLTEAQYFSILTEFNEKNYEVMYYLTRAELLTLLDRFFENRAP